MNIAEQLQHIKSQLPENVTLVAVSKTKPLAAIMEAYNTGHRDFGENRVQEMVEKWEKMPKDIQWHMIGHVQRNKVKYMAEFVHLIHGVDSFRLLKEINKQAKKNNRKIDCLLQMHIAEEDTKYGLDKEELHHIINSDEFKAMNNVTIKGLMGMATFTDDMSQVRKEFKFLKNCYDDLKNQLPQISVLSMGMSGDFEVAIEEGSNMVRIGSSIFGARSQ